MAYIFNESNIQLKQFQPSFYFLHPFLRLETCQLSMVIPSIAIDLRLRIRRFHLECCFFRQSFIPLCSIPNLPWCKHTVSRKHKFRLIFSPYCYLKIKMTPCHLLTWCHFKSFQSDCQWVLLTSTTFYTQATENFVEAFLFHSASPA